MPTLLAIDDDEVILVAFRRIFRDADLTLLTASTATAGIEAFEQTPPDAVLLDINLPDLSGLETFRRLQQLDARIPIIFVTGSGTTETAIEAMKLGAYEYLLKDDLFERTDELRELVERAFEISNMSRVPALVSDKGLPDAKLVEGPAEALIGRCPAMQEIYKAIGRVASQDVTVLILGESGTGKELVARAIYQHSRRSSGPFLTINCAAIPESLLESELFGHEKGAFTGADHRRIGKFEQCSGGTLFLDEIGDMTAMTQVKMLRVLQQQRFERVGGNETIETNVRLIAATNRNLTQRINEGEFREDLYYRLGVFTIKLPPLRDRGDDLERLLNYFLHRFNRELGREILRIAPETLEILKRHKWPGNVRELQSALKNALLRASGTVLVPDFLPEYLTRPVDEQPSISQDHPWQQYVQDRLQAGSENVYSEVQELMEKHLLAQVLEHTDGNQVQAAKILGIARNSLRQKIRTLGMSIQRSVKTDT